MDISSQREVSEKFGMLSRKVLRCAKEWRYSSLVTMLQIVDELIHGRLLCLGKRFHPLNQFRCIPHNLILPPEFANGT